MAELCKDLKLSIWREDDQIRVQLVNEMEMLETEVCYQINPTEEKTLRSGRYFVQEAVVLAMRRVVSQAFRQGLITDPPGVWKISKPQSSPVDQEVSDDIDLDGFML